MPIPDVAGAVRALCDLELHELHVGTDSIVDGGGTRYVTVVALLRRRGGGRVFYCRSRERGRQSLAQRLFREAELSLRTAVALRDALGRAAVVHVDVNEDERHRSARYAAALAGMVRGYGFDLRLKPGAWCATHVADYLVRERSPRAA